MNLYAITPSWGPDVTFELAESGEQAMKHGVFVAAHDLTAPVYGSPSAEVYLIARNVEHVGTAYASDAPPEWQWAHPAVEEALADHVLQEAAWEACGDGDS
jgi:hypothetical protein